MKEREDEDMKKKDGKKEKIGEHEETGEEERGKRGGKKAGAPGESNCVKRR